MPVEARNYAEDRMKVADFPALMSDFHHLAQCMGTLGGVLLRDDHRRYPQ